LVDNPAIMAIRVPKAIQDQLVKQVTWVELGFLVQQESEVKLDPLAKRAHLESLDQLADQDQQELRVAWVKEDRRDSKEIAEKTAQLVKWDHQEPAALQEPRVLQEMKGSPVLLGGQVERVRSVKQEWLETLEPQELRVALDNLVPQVNRDLEETWVQWELLERQGLKELQG